VDPYIRDCGQNINREDMRPELTDAKPDFGPSEKYYILSYQTRPVAVQPDLVFSFR
jgi:hypothetical protein